MALGRRRPSRLLTFELVGPCNLHCAYCLRSESMLYGKASFLSRSRVVEILRDLRRQWGAFSVVFTGGEPSLHPELGGILDDVCALGTPYKVVTNGWHFDKIVNDLVRTRAQLLGIAFSLDGTSREAHDRWRGKGSFDRMMRAMTSAKFHNLPFQANVVLRKDTLPQMEAFAVMVARLGGAALNFGAMLPTTSADFDALSLSPDEERQAGEEARELSRVLKMPVRTVLRLFEPTPGAHCYPLLGRSLNVNHLGQLTLCGNLSFFRGGDSGGDVAASATPAARVLELRDVGQTARVARDHALEACGAGETPGTVLSSPCLSCLKHFDKLSWDKEIRA